MATYNHDGLTLSYDNFPQGDQVTYRDLSFTVMLEPLNPSNSVTLWYRVDEGPVQTLNAVEGPCDYVGDTQCFRAVFPRFEEGQSIDYAVSGNCAGRQVPDPTSMQTLPHSFRVGNPRTNVPPRAEPRLEARPPSATRSRYELRGEFVANFTIHIEAPRIVGPTPDGIRVTWNATTGSVEGPKLHAKVLQGADWVTIRTDGMAHLDVRALLETPEGVKIMTTYAGLAELGDSGYQNFLSGNWPQSFSAWTAPRFWAADSKYAWLNRLQCVSIGEVFLAEPVYVYDVYALR